MSTTIKLEDETYKRLKALGKKGDFFDDIVLKLIIFYDNYSGQVRESSPLSED